MPTSCVFGTHQKEARTLASNVNLELTEDVETALALIAGLYEKREQGICFRDYGNGEHIFKPRTSRVEGIVDVSSPHRPRATKSGGVIVTKDDILNADDGYNIYSDDPALKSFTQEFMPCTPLFHLTCWTDASYAPRGENGRSELYYVVQLNGAPVDFNPITMTGVADSASTAEYCGASVGVKETEGTRESGRFLGIAVHKVTQYTDATSTKQIAENPKKLGSTRHLGIRWHLVRYHLHAKDLVLSCGTTETGNCLADLGTKRLARKILARFSIIFYTCLSKTWRKNPDNLEHICGVGVFVELD
jgi:hypothetical protein